MVLEVTGAFLRNKSCGIGCISSILHYAAREMLRCFVDSHNDNKDLTHESYR